MTCFSVELRTAVIERGGLQEEHDRLMQRHSLLLQVVSILTGLWTAIITKYAGAGYQGANMESSTRGGGEQNTPNRG